MPEEKLKVIVLTHGGAGPFLELLSQNRNDEIRAIFVETVIERTRTLTEKIRRSIRYDGYLATFAKFSRTFSRGNGVGVSAAVTDNQNELARYAGQLNIPLIRVENYHSAQSLKLLAETGADLGVLYGTNIIRDTVFSIPRLGSINIHQGLAPFYRGGPTVFWELFNDEREIGITVHFVAAKVDTGDIILQETVKLDYDFSKYGLNYEEFLADFRASLVGLSSRLLAEAVRQIAGGTISRQKQDTTIGRRYKLPVKSEKDQLLRLLKERQKSR